GTSTQQPADQEELQQGLAEMQSTNRELHLQLQDHTVEIQRIEDQIAMLRQSVERTAAEHAKLVENVHSLSNLIRLFGAGLAILLIVLIVFAVLLLTHPR